VDRVNPCPSQQSYSQIQGWGYAAFTTLRKAVAQSAMRSILMSGAALPTSLPLPLLSVQISLVPQTLLSDGTANGEVRQKWCEAVSYSKLYVSDK
jgi:hypothetical protein